MIHNMQAKSQISPVLALQSPPLDAFLKTIKNSSFALSFSTASGSIYGLVKKQEKYLFDPPAYQTIKNLAEKHYNLDFSAQVEKQNLLNLEAQIKQRHKDVQSFEINSSEFDKLPSQLNRRIAELENNLAKNKQVIEHWNLLDGYKYKNNGIVKKMFTHMSPSYFKFMLVAGLAGGAALACYDGINSYQDDGQSYDRHFFGFGGRTIGGLVGSAAGAKFGLLASFATGLLGVCAGEYMATAYYDQHSKQKLAS